MKGCVSGGKNIRIYLILTLVIVFSFPHAAEGQITPYNKFGIDTLSGIEEKIDVLISQMTLEEKIGQMSQIRHFDENSDEFVASRFVGSVIHTDGPRPGENASEWQARFTALQKIALSTRMGIPLIFGVDALHGQNTFEGATIFPHNIGMGATRNALLVQEAAAITALETQATGFSWTFSPCIAIPYSEKWGRVYEAYSESTELTEELARASVQGHQGQLASRNTVLATAKHYLGDGTTDYGVEGGITSISAQEISKRLLPPYQAAVEEGTGAIMVSFNSISGIFMHAHKGYITDSLKRGMNYDGMVVSDWKGYSRFGENDIINAGVDMAMAVDGNLDFFQSGLKKGVLSGEVSRERIDDAVRRILRQKFRLGLFENPFPDSTLIPRIGCAEHRDKARQAVRESLVLLKNEGQVLPIDKNAEKIVVVGEHANDAGLQSGGWTLSWQGGPRDYSGATTILEGIKKLAAGTVVYDQEATGKHSDADVAVIVVGEKPYAEFFGDIKNDSSAFQLTLTEEHQRYVNSYSGQGPKIVAVLISGRPLVVSEQINQSDAFVAAWLPGSEGDGIAEVLFGDYNFTGKLPHSWPRSVDDFKGKFGPNFWDKSIPPLFEFGYGLSY
jgi:beta-glucosidase